MDKYDKSYFNEDYYSRKNIFEVIKRGGYIKKNYKKENEWKWRYISKFFKKNKGAILDVGCGVGSFLECVPKNFEKCGVDISKFSTLKSNKKGFNTKVGDISKKIPFEKKFDVVTAFDTLEHILELDLALKNVKKIMKKDSFFIVEVPIKTNFHNFISLFNLGLLNIDPTHCNKFYLDKWIKILSKEFIIVEAKKVTIEDKLIPGFGLLGLFVLKRKN